MISFKLISNFENRSSFFLENVDQKIDTDLKNDEETVWTTFGNLFKSLLNYIKWYLFFLNRCRGFQENVEGSSKMGLPIHAHIIFPV